MQRHRHQEFIRFLNAAEAAVPADKIVHAILDNYAVHKHPRVRAWLSRHPRWVFHFTPTSASWLNAVEGFFSALTRRRLRRGDFISLVDLQGAINIAEHNNDPRPFVWTKPAKLILDKIKRHAESSECVSALAILLTSASVVLTAQVGAGRVLTTSARPGWRRSSLVSYPWRTHEVRSSDCTANPHRGRWVAERAVSGHGGL